MKTSNVTTDHNQAIIRGWVDPVSLPDDAAGSGSGGATQTRNDSGGALVAGDVVVLDTDGNVITTTTAQDTRPVGVVLDDIASGEYGPIAWQGPVPYVNVTASVTAGRYAETSTSAANATENATRRAGSFALYTSSGTTPTAFLFGGGGGSGIAGGDVATDVIWDAAGDLVVGTGANTAARLAIGAVGGRVSRINGAVAWDSGTANPTAAANDRYWRTDLGLEVFYDGTRWLSLQAFNIELTPNEGLQPYSASGALTRGLPPVWSGDVYLLATRTWFYVAGGTALSGSHKWVGAVQNAPAGTVYDTVNIDSGASDTHRQSGIVSIGALMGTTNFELECSWTKTGTPGALYTRTVVTCRLVVT